MEAPGSIAAEAAVDTQKAIHDSADVSVVFDGPIKLRIICGKGFTVEIVVPHTIH